MNTPYKNNWADYYAVLELSRPCTHLEVKTAYKQLALIHHPDKNNDDPNATSRFQALIEAHEVLSNDVSRRHYDQYTERLHKRTKKSAQKTKAKSKHRKPANTTERCYTQEKYSQGSFHTEVDSWRERARREREWRDDKDYGWDEDIYGDGNDAEGEPSVAVGADGEVYVCTEYFGAELMGVRVLEERF